MAKKQLKGVVVSNKMKKTVVVEVLKFKYFLKYKKRYRFHKKYKAHSEQDYQIGDRVLIEECRPLSRDKRWRVLQKISSQAKDKEIEVEISSEENGNDLKDFSLELGNS